MNIDPDEGMSCVGEGRGVVARKGDQALVEEDRGEGEVTSLAKQS